MGKSPVRARPASAPADGGKPLAPSRRGFLAAFIAFIAIPLAAIPAIRTRIKSGWVLREDDR